MTRWNERSLIPLNHRDGHLEVRAAIDAYRNDGRNLPVRVDGNGVEWCRDCGGGGSVMTAPPGGATCPNCDGEGYLKTDD